MVDFADEVIKLKPGSAELEQIRASALGGQKHDLKTYVYFCILQGIRQNRELTPKNKIREFRKLVDLDVIGVELG